MKARRKIAALVFALLMIFSSATYYSASDYMLEKQEYAGTKGISFTSYAERTINFFLQQKSLSSNYQGWKTEVGFPGLYSLNNYVCRPPLNIEIRKIFVIDSSIYSPCKSIILFPFHEFF